MKLLNKKKALVLSTALGLSCLISTPALAGGGVGLGLLGIGAGAAAHHFYGGGSAGGSSLDPEVRNCCGKLKSGTSSSSDVGLKLNGGYNINRKLAVEGFYTDLGSSDIKVGSKKQGSVDYAAYGAALVLSHPVAQKIKLRGKLGYGAMDTTVSGGVKHEEKNTGYLYKGVGAEYMINKALSVVADYDHFNKDAQLLSTGIRFNFK
jgi:hypothetical protein